MAKLTDKQIEEELEKIEDIPAAVEWLRYLELGVNSSDYGHGSVLCIESSTRGGGMTVCSVAMCWMEHTRTRKPVYSNIKLNFPYKPLSKIDFNKAVSSILLIDDSHMMFDARLHASAKNRLWSYLLAQARRRGLTIILSTPEMDWLDLRVRGLVDIRGRCHSPGKGIFHLSLLDRNTAKRVSVRIDGKTFYPMYDSTQILKINKRR